MEEEWKPVKGFEKYYEISNLGRVKSLPRLVKSRNHFISKEKIRNNCISNTGYLTIGLSKEGKVVNKLVHILVAEAFIPNPNNLPEVNHKDGVKSNPNVKNLEWVTKSENHIHAYKMGLQKSNLKYKKGEEHVSSKLNWVKVKEIRILLLNKVSQRKIAKQYNVSQVTISNINQNKIWIQDNL